MRMPELENARVQHRWQWHPTWFSIALPLDADKIRVLVLGSAVCWRKGDGLVIVVGGFEGDGKDGGDGV